MYITGKELSFYNEYYFISKSALKIWNRETKNNVFYLSFFYRHPRNQPELKRTCRILEN